MTKIPDDHEFNVTASPAIPDMGVAFPNSGSGNGSMYVTVRVPDHGSKTVDQINAEAIDLARVKFKSLIRAYRGKNDD